MNVVFDLGGILVHWEPARLVREHFPAHAPDADAAAALARAMFLHEDWHGFDGGWHSPQEVIDRMVARLGLPVQGLQALVGSLGERLVPIPEGIAVLRELHARRQAGEPLRLFYLSNMPVPYARTLEQRHDFFECFDAGVFSGDVRHIKPHEAIYRLLALRHALVPSDTLFIDDVAPNVATARMLGWQAIHCTSPAALGRQVSDHLARHARAADG